MRDDEGELSPDLSRGKVRVKGGGRAAHDLLELLGQLARQGDRAVVAAGVEAAAVGLAGGDASCVVARTRSAGRGSAGLISPETAA